MSTNRDLKAYIRIDGSGRDVAGSLVLRTKMPKNGKWRQVLASQCCNPVVTPATPALVLGGRSTGRTGNDSRVCFNIEPYVDVYMSLATPNVIAIGDTFYTDAAGTSPLVGGEFDSWNKFTTPDGTEYAVAYDENGVVFDVVLCEGGGEPVLKF